MKKYMMTGMLACVLVFAAGCTLRPSINEGIGSSQGASGNDFITSDTGASSDGTDSPSQPQTIEGERPVIEVIPSTASPDESQDPTQYVYETVPIEPAELPVDSNGEWTDFILGTDVLDVEWEAPTFGEQGCRFHVDDFPVIYVSDSDKEVEINSIINQYVINDYPLRFQMVDLDISLTCSVMSATRFVSYQLEGLVRHIGDDVRYEDEREYRYYFTVDRMTGQQINLETAFGVEAAYEEICNGNFEVVRASDSVFERFTNEMLADVYVNEPFFADDMDHKLDFYIQNGYVHVVIWVGEENGSYAILRLLRESNI